MKERKRDYTDFFDRLNRFTPKGIRFVKVRGNRASDGYHDKDDFICMRFDAAEKYPYFYDANYFYPGFRQKDLEDIMNEVLPDYIHIGKDANIPIFSEKDKKEIEKDFQKFVESKISKVGGVTSRIYNLANFRYDAVFINQSTDMAAILPLIDEYGKITTKANELYQREKELNDRIEELEKEKPGRRKRKVHENSLYGLRVQKRENSELRDAVHSRQNEAIRKLWDKLSSKNLLFVSFVQALGGMLRNDALHYLKEKSGRAKAKANASAKGARIPFERKKTSAAQEDKDGRNLKILGGTARKLNPPQISMAAKYSDANNKTIMAEIKFARPGTENAIFAELARKRKVHS